MSSLFSEKPKAELDAIAAEFDREFVMDTFRPLTNAEWADWQEWRPRLTHRRKVRRISLTLASALVERVDRAAKRLHVDRSTLLARSLEHLLEGLEEK